MNAADLSIQDLAKSLGEEYTVREIDLEQVVYRDFGNGFNVEISGMHTTRASARATIYLWHGEGQRESSIILAVDGVSRERIGIKVNMLYEISEIMVQNNVSHDDIISLGWRMEHLYDR